MGTVEIFDSLDFSGNVYANNTFYMEKILVAAFGSIIGFYVALALLIATCFFSEYKKNGFYAAACFILFSVSIYVWGGENTQMLLAIFNWQIVAAYLGIGLAHAIYRFYMEGRKIGDLISKKRIEWKKDKKIDSLTSLTPEQENQFRYHLMGKDGEYNRYLEKREQETDEEKKKQIKIHEYSILELMTYISDNVTLSKFERYQIINAKTSALRWWFNWPVSLVYYFFSEMFSEMWNFIWGKFRKLFNGIFIAGVNATAKEK